MKVSRIVERLDGEYAHGNQDLESRFRTVQELDQRPILNKNKISSDRPSARNVQFKLPLKLDIGNIETSKTQKNAGLDNRNKFFEPKKNSKVYKPTKPAEPNSAAINRRLSPRDLVLKRNKYSAKKAIGQHDEQLLRRAL